MSLHRFFAEERPGSGAMLPDGVLPLSPADVHHLRDVLRLQPGDEIVLVSGGAASRVRLTAVADEVHGEAVGEIASPDLAAVTLVQGLAKGEKMEQIVRQATELGVTRIVPFAAERSVVRLEGDKAAARVERWRRVAAEAAKQSQRVDVPQISPVAGLVDLPVLLEGVAVLVCWEDADSAPGIRDALTSVAFGAEVAVVVGPEGGLTAREVTALKDAGATVVSLGGTVLRTETAGVVAAALAIYERGGLGARHG